MAHWAVSTLTAPPEQLAEGQACVLSADVQATEQPIHITPVAVEDVAIVFIKVSMVYFLDGSTAVSWEPCAYPRYAAEWMEIDGFISRTDDNKLIRVTPVLPQRILEPQLFGDCGGIVVNRRQHLG